MLRSSVFFCILVVISGCAAGAAPVAPQVARTAPHEQHTGRSLRRWCEEVPDLTDDSSGDLTGKRNTLARVRGVLGTLDVRFMSCAGVNGVGLSTVDLIELVIADGKPPSGPTSEDDATWAIWIHVRSADALPSTNPLYLRGVRV